MARPSSYTTERGIEAANFYAEAPGDLREAFAARDDLPDLTTLYRWELDIPEFRDLLARARRTRAHHLAESLLGIADENMHDTIVKRGRDGEEIEVANHEWINRSRLRVETRKWLAQRLNPDAYGERTQQGGTVEVVHRIHMGKKPE